MHGPVGIRGVPVRLDGSLVGFLRDSLALKGMEVPTFVNPRG